MNLLFFFPPSFSWLDSGDDDASGHQTTAPVIEVAPKGRIGALGSLAASYDSNSEESDAENVPNSKHSLTHGWQRPVIITPLFQKVLPE